MKRSRVLDEYQTIKMKTLISFDIGIRNLAYCVFSLDKPVDKSTNNSILAWDVLDISQSPGSSDKPLEEESDKRVCSCVLQSKGTSKKKEKTKEKNNQSCKKKAKYRNNIGAYYCEKHAKEAQEKKEYYLPKKEFQTTFLKKQKVDFLVEFERKYGIVFPSETGTVLEEKKEKKEDRVERIEKWVQENTFTFLADLKNENGKKNGKKEIGLVEIGRNMARHLFAVPQTIREVDTVLIENQISPIANKMKTIQGMLAQIYILHGIPNIEFVSSSNKLKGFGSFGTKEEKEEVEEKEKEQENKEEPKKEKEGTNMKEKKTKNPNYKQHKKDGITFCKQLLETRGETEWKTFFETYPKKQDDLADAFLQGIWYLSRNLVKK